MGCARGDAACWDVANEKPGYCRVWLKGVGLREGCDPRRGGRACTEWVWLLPRWGRGVSGGGRA